MLRFLWGLLVLSFIHATKGTGHPCSSVQCPQLSCASKVKEIGACCPTCGSTTNATHVEHHDVVVVGLGFAGSEMATLLSQDGKDFIALEARGTFGGRAQRIRLANGIDVPQGAGWVEGNINNPMFPRIAECQISSVEQPFIQFAIFDNLGLPIPGGKVFRTLTRYQAAVDCVTEKSAQLRQQNLPDMDLRQALRLCGWFVRNNQVIDRVGAYIDQSAFNANDVEIGIKMNFRPTNVSGIDTFIIDPRGTEELAGCWLDKFVAGGRSSSKLKYNSRVNNTNMNLKIVETNDGRKFSYGTIFDTRSFSPIQRNWVRQEGSLFTPKLSTRRMEAMMSVHYRGWNRVYLTFDQKFWGDEEYVAVSPTAATDEYAFHNLDRPGFHPGSKTLVTWLTGRMGDYMEFMTDDQIATSLMGGLKNAFGPSTPDPVDVKVIRWGRKPNFRGAYPSMGPSFTLQSYRRMNALAGYDDSMVFAGNAYCRNTPYTLEGAIMAATARFKEWKKKNGELPPGVNPRANNLCFF